MFSRRIEIPARLKKPLTGLLLVVGIAILVAMARAVYQVLTSNLEDFYLYYLAASAFRSKMDVYSMHSWEHWQPLADALRVPTYAPPYRYPPLLAVLIMPLLALPPRAAGFVWTVVNTMAALGAVAVLAVILPGGRKRLPWMWLIAVLFVPVLSTLVSGQVNALVLLSIAVALWAVQRNRQLLGGLALSIGVMVKLMPLTLVAYFLWRRQWRVVAGAIAGTAILALICIPFVGWDAMLSYGQHMVMKADPHLLQANPQNQSLVGFFSRILTAYPWGASWADNPPLAWALGRGFGLLLLGATFLLCWPARRIGSLLLEETSLVIIATLLYPSICWYHYLMLLLIPLFTLLWSNPDDPRRRIRIWVAIACLLAINLYGILWLMLLKQPLLLSLATYAALVLWGTLAWVVFRDSRAVVTHTRRATGIARQSDS